MSANIDASDNVRQLDRRPDPNETVVADNIKDPTVLARLLTRLLRDVARLKNRWGPRRIDFEDQPVGSDGTTLYSFDHGFSGRVRWYVVDWAGDLSAVALLARDASSTEDTLVLRSYASGLATVRVEPSG